MKHHYRSRPSSTARQSFTRRDNSRDERASLSAELGREQSEALEKIRERKKILLEILKEKHEKSANKAAWKAYIVQYEKDLSELRPDHPRKLSAAQQKSLEQLLRGYESHFAKDLKERKDLKPVIDRISIKAPEEVFVSHGTEELYAAKAHHTLGFKFPGKTHWVWFHPDQTEAGDAEADGYHIERTSGYDGEGVRVILQRGTTFSYVIEEWAKYQDYKKEDVVSPSQPQKETRTAGDPFGGLSVSAAQSFEEMEENEAEEIPEEPEVEAEREERSSNLIDQAEELVFQRERAYQHAQGLSLPIEDDGKGRLVVQDLETIKQLSADDLAVWKALIEEYVAPVVAQNPRLGPVHKVLPLSEQLSTHPGRMLRRNFSVDALVELYRQEKQR